MGGRERGVSEWREKERSEAGWERVEEEEVGGERDYWGSKDKKK